MKPFDYNLERKRSGTGMEKVKNITVSNENKEREDIKLFHLKL